MKNIYIYRLIDPRNGKIRYIGKATNVELRLAGHISAAKKNQRQTRCVQWIKSLLSINSKPLVEVIEITNEESWQEREKYWIAFYKTSGADLCNHTDGGEGLVNPSEITKEKQRANNRRNAHKYQTAEFKAKISALSKALVRTPEHRRKISESKKGKPMHKAIIEAAIKVISKPVCKYSLDGVELARYGSVKECASINNLDLSWLIKRIKRNKPMKKHIYKYVCQID